MGNFYILIHISLILFKGQKEKVNTIFEMGEKQWKPFMKWEKKKLSKTFLKWEKNNSEHF